MKNVKIGDRIHVVPNYGHSKSWDGVITGIERNDDDTVTALLIQPAFEASIYIDLRDQGFTLLAVDDRRRKAIN